MGLTRPRAHQLQDIDYKQTARVITTANVTLSGGAPATVDGTSLALTNRVLVTAQTTGTENGIYEVTVVGSGSNGTWVRTEDANATGDIKGGTIIMITEGTVYADTQWKLTTDNPITIGSTVLTFARNGNAAFGVVAVSGQSDLVSDQIGDTLTVVAGTNIALTTNAGTDTLTMGTTGNVSLSDNGYLKFGDNGDFELHHDGTNSIIRSTNHLTWIQTNDTLNISKFGGSEYMARFVADGAVDLRYNNVTKILTTSTGATITGNLSLTGGGITSTADIIIDSTTSDEDIVFKGNDGGSVITALTLDMSTGGTGVFNNGVQAVNYFWGSKGDNAIILYAGANFEVRLTHVHNTGFTLTNAGTGTPAVELQFVDSNEAIGSDGTNLLLTSGGTEFKFPTADGSNEQVLQTNGNGTLSFVDQSGGGSGSGDSFPNSSVTPLPSSEGNFDLAKQYDQTGSVETPFETGATDAFGVSLGQIYTMMDPVGSTLSPTDLGVLS